MIIKYPHYTIIILVLFLSCRKQVESSLQSCLQQVGENRYIQEHVIRHFEHNVDSHKLDAARFLIYNMQYHSTLTSPEVERYYEQMDSINQLTPTRWSISPEQDSLFNSLESPFDKPLKKVFDNQIIKAEELISHIDYMFALYDSAVWCKGVNNILKFPHNSP